jgi:hypothetical protein
MDDGQMGIDHDKIPDNPRDYRRARIIVAFALAALFPIALVADSITGIDGLDIYKSVAILTAICALLGINRVRLGGL